VGEEQPVVQHGAVLRHRRPARRHECRSTHHHRDRDAPGADDREDTADGELGQAHARVHVRGVASEVHAEGRRADCERDQRAAERARPALGTRWTRATTAITVYAAGSRRRARRPQKRPRDTPPVRANSVTGRAVMR
jgi:hypothetical protein